MNNRLADFGIFEGSFYSSDGYNVEYELKPKKVEKSNPFVKIDINVTNELTIIEEGGNDMGKLLPKHGLGELIEKFCTEEEKNKYIMDITSAAIESFKTGDDENLRQTLLDWEYTLVWKKNHHLIEKIEFEQENNEDAVDWKDFLGSNETGE